LRSESNVQAGKKRMNCRNSLLIFARWSVQRRNLVTFSHERFNKKKYNYFDGGYYDY